MNRWEKLLTAVALGYTPARGLSARMARELLEEEPSLKQDRRAHRGKENGRSGKAD